MGWAGARPHLGTGWLWWLGLGVLAPEKWLRGLTVPAQQVAVGSGWGFPQKGERQELVGLCPDRKHFQL